MRKSLSLSVLGITVASLIFIGAGMVINEPKYGFEDIKGSKESLEDVVFIQENNTDLYKNVQSIVSKDGFEVKKYSNSKDKKFGDSDYERIISSNKDVFKNVYPLSEGIYKSDENVGYIEDHSLIFNEDGTYLQQFLIRNKNLKTNEINEWYVTLPEKIKEDVNIESRFAVSIKDNKLYILITIIQDTIYNINGEATDIDDSYLNLYTFNLENQEIKLKDSYKPIKDGEYVFDTNEVFEKDNKMYTLVGKISLKDENKLDYYLAYYDINRNKFETIKEPVIKDSASSTLGGNIVISNDIEGDILYILQHDKSEEKNANVELSKINLKNNKVEYINKQYHTSNANDEYYVNSFRVIDKKVYIGITKYEEENKKYGSNMDVNDYIVVLDENTGQTLYKGEYINETGYYPPLRIMKNNEL